MMRVEPGLHSFGYAANKDEMEDLTRLAELIRTRNAVAAEIAALIGRPAQLGHVGEYVASRIFDICLCESASRKASGGILHQPSSECAPAEREGSQVDQSSEQRRRRTHTLAVCGYHKGRVRIRAE